VSVLELEEKARPLFEMGGKVQPDPFEEEPVMAARFVPLEGEFVVVLVPHPRLSPKVDRQGAYLHILQARPELVLVVRSFRLSSLLGKSEPRREEEGQPGQPGRSPGDGPSASWLAGS
jgi:hypothetical protein